MAKTIRLLATYNGYKRNDIITLDDATADKLLLGGVSATLDLTDGVPAFQQGPNGAASTGTNLPADQTITAGQTVTLLLPANVALTVSGSAGINGTMQILNPDDTVSRTQALTVGEGTTGVFLRDTKVKFLVSFGTLTTRAGVAVGARSDLPVFTREENLGPGDDEVNNWKFQAPAGTQGQDFGPIQTPAGPMPNSSVVLGGSGGVGDLLRMADIMVRDPLNGAVYLEEGSEDADTVSGIVGTAPADAATTLALTATVAFTAAANQYADCILWFMYQPTGAGRPIKFMRRIVSHAAVANAMAFAPALTHGVPAGAAITAWGIRPAFAALEISQFNQAGRRIDFNRQCTKEGGWRISVDKGAFVLTGGQYTW